MARNPRRPWPFPVAQLCSLHSRRTRLPQASPFLAACCFGSLLPKRALRPYLSFRPKRRTALSEAEWESIPTQRPSHSEGHPQLPSRRRRPPHNLPTHQNLQRRETAAATDHADAADERRWEGHGLCLGGQPPAAAAGVRGGATPPAAPGFPHHSRPHRAAFTLAERCPAVGLIQRIGHAVERRARQCARLVAWGECNTPAMPSK